MADSDHAKRALTRHLRESNDASNAFTTYSPATDPDVAARLKSVGARVRKNVTEGYATNRYSRTHGPGARTQSTGDLFTSSSDVLADVYSNSNLKSASTPSHKHRIDDSLEDIPESPNTRAFDDLHLDDRPIKPLKRSTFSKTQSLPAAFGPSAAAVAVPSKKSTAIAEVREDEEDWSLQSGSFQTGPDDFE
ncbi:hypothetical protein CYLTODRAFT_189581 [Cylindrobasidium torrendii FP15055 ss-10]|uniref:Uncharacterized protein n=1 Tax=Cylindrobasidium torrendii FP15055 ss-10 TaxID=1314674 RepID=A0A0D7BTQ0_9AGAR|nr:hypothetical protein CYLTODRAFT_189581 [Cylindrobasidium torrendii FP15055 ss-10]